MARGDAAAEVDTLVAKLGEATPNMTRLIALLWTWLDRHLVEFGSLKQKPPTIYAEAAAGPPFAGIDQGTLDWVAEAPLRNSALLLARIGIAVGQTSAVTAQSAEGFEGEEVYVFRRRSDLVRRTGGKNFPPGASEHPSISTLVPALVVCPLEVGGIALREPRVGGYEWDAVLARLEDTQIWDVPSGFEVHLDSLGEAGYSEWDLDGDSGTAALREEDATTAEIDAALAAVHAAIDRSRDSADILVMPELAAGEEVREQIGEDLAAAADGPVLTVIGSYHVPVSEENPELADFYNEAIVYGPGGGELWRHRKLTAAGAKVPIKGGERAYVVEDIRLGAEVSVTSTPIGTVAVLTCLDCFARQGRDRLIASPANVLIVPSLSDSVERHRGSLHQLVGAIWGIAFVCNRATQPHPTRSCWDEADNRSFWAIQRKGLVEAAPCDGRPAFIFRLSEHEVKDG